jgi:hypothetical protein
MTTEIPTLNPDILKRLIKRSKTIYDLYDAIYQRGVKDGSRETENRLYMELQHLVRIPPES